MRVRALVYLLYSCICQCMHTTVEYNEKRKDAGDSQSFNELIEEQLLPLADW